MTQKFGVGVLSLVVFLLFSTTSVAAQVSTTSAASSPSASIVSDSDVLKTQAQQLRDTYRQDLENYRNDARLYTIALGQFTQLQTLASLDEAVQDTQQVMLSRLQVLETYVKLLKVILLSTPGLDPTLRTTQVKLLDQLLSDLQTHQNHVTIATDRPHIAKMVTEFVPIEQRLEKISNATVVMISYGNIQAVYDETITLKNDIRTMTEQDEKDPLQLAAKRRGLDEIDRELSDVSGQVKSSQDQVKQSINSDFFDNSAFQQMLSKIYGALSRSLSLLEESLH